MKKSDKYDLGPAVKIIKEFEGFYAKAYRCPANVVTIGWGTIKYPNGKRVQIGDRCTEAQAEEWLMFEVTEKSEAVKKMLAVDVSNNAFCALVSFAYNLGVGALAKSTLLKQLNDKEDLEYVAKQFGRWVNAGGKKLRGLVRRREAEKALFLS